MSFLSQLKYRYLGHVVKNRARRQAFEDSLQAHNRVSKFDVGELAVREGVLWQKRQSVMDAAHDVYRLYHRSGDRQVLDRLRTVYHKLRSIDRELKAVEKARDFVTRTQAIRDAQDMDIFLEQSMLDEHYRQKIRKWTRPPLRTMSKRLTKMQMEREMGQELQQEYASTFLSGEDDEEYIL